MRHLAWLVAGVLVVACSGGTPSISPGQSPPPAPAFTQTATPTATATALATATAGSMPPPTSLATSSPTEGPSYAPTFGPFVDAPLPDSLASDLQGVLNGYVDTAHLSPSLSVAVIVPGVGTWAGVAGIASADTPTTPDTVYAVGSITKTFVAALNLRLAEEGYLGLDDPAADHLGPVAGAKTNGATVRQLLGQRSGIDSYTDRFDQGVDRQYSVAELVDMIGEPHFAPGTDWEYSNSNYLLLGLIAEAVTGGPLGELLHEYLIDRLGLGRTYYGASDVAPEPVAHGYFMIDGEERDLYDGSGHLPFASAAQAALGAGSMASTAPDVARWIYLLFGGQVLSAESQSAMLDFRASIVYGLGVMRFALPGTGELIGHSGSIPGFGSAAYMARESGIIVVILTNGESFDYDGALNRLVAVSLAAQD